MNSTNENNSIYFSKPNIDEYKVIVKDIITNPIVQELKNHIQHANKSRFYHCLYVSYLTYAICKRLNLDYVSASRGAMLHDLYFYDWHKKDIEHGQPTWHAFKHPGIALNNAKKIFNLNDKEQDIIVKHMWPLTIILPAYKESYIVTFVDKYCTVFEVFRNIKYNLILKGEKLW